MYKTIIITILGLLISTTTTAQNIQFTNTKPVRMTETVSGIAVAVTAGSIQVSDIIVVLSGIRDLDRDREVCRWRTKAFDPNPNDYPPSVDIGEYQAFCDQNPHGTKNSSYGSDRYKCELSFTAVDQMEKLRDIVDGNQVRCSIPSKAEMKQFWDEGLNISRTGDKQYPGHCYIGKKSVSERLMETGWAALATTWNHGLVDEKFYNVRKVIGDDAKKYKTTGTKLRATRALCFKDRFHQEHPDWYN